MENASSTGPWWSGKIERKRNICSNRWRVAGTRITVDAIKSFHEAAYSVAEIIGQYPSLTPAQVEAAIRFPGP